MSLEGVAELRFVKLSAYASTPIRSSFDAAGLDLFSAEDIAIAPGGRACVATDIMVEVPHGFYGRVAPRSGLALKFGINVGGGVIDADFRGNIGVILFNHGDDVFSVRKFDRIAQLVIEKIAVLVPTEVSSLDQTARGSDGFGSTGQ